MDKKDLIDGCKPKVVILSDSEQTKKLREAVARRAYEIFAHRGSVGGHELEDWRQAEGEIVKPLCGGLIVLEQNVWVETGTTLFEAGSIEIWVADRNITICGKPCSSHRNARNGENGTAGWPEIIFRVLDLPVKIDPSGTTLKLHAESVEILFKKARTEPEQKVKVAA